MAVYTPQTIVDTLVEYVDKILCLDNYLHSKCIEDACRLKQVVIAFVKNCQLHPFLTIFGHSVSCTSPDCSASCHIFRRIRSYIQNGVASSIVTESHEHICAIMHVYGQLIRMHVDTCVSDVCGMHSCKDMKSKDTRSSQRHLLKRNWSSRD